MKKVLILCVLSVSFAMAAKKNVAVFPCFGNLNDKELKELRFKIEEIGNNVLSQSDNFKFMQHDALDKNIDLKAVHSSCSEGGTCLKTLTSDANADYGTWCQVDKADGKLTLFFQLFDNDENSNLYTKMFKDLKNVNDALKIIEAEIPAAFKRMLPKEQPPVVAAPPVAAVDSSTLKMQQAMLQQMEQMQQMQQEMLKGQSKGQQAAIPIVSIASEPQGATLVFDGKPNSYCPKTPCVTELEKGKHNISALLNLGGGLNEKADTTVFITENTKTVSIKLKPNYGTLGIVGTNEQWSLTIDGNYAYWNGANVLPGNYEVRLTHNCYEDINFSTNIDKGESKYFNINDKLVPRKGYLVLKASRRSANAKEPVWVNGKQVGKTPFSDSIPVCARIEIGSEKERINVKLEENKSVEHTHKMASHSQWAIRAGYIRKSITLSEDLIAQGVKISSNDFVSSGFGLGIAKNIPAGDFLSFNLEFNAYTVGGDGITGEDIVGGTLTEDGYILNASIIIQFMPLKKLPLFLSAGPRFDFNLVDFSETTIEWQTTNTDVYYDKYGRPSYSTNTNYHYYDYTPQFFGLALVVGAGYYIIPSIAADFRYTLLDIVNSNDNGCFISQWGLGLSYLF